MSKLTNVGKSLVLGVLMVAGLAGCGRLPGGVEQGALQVTSNGAFNIYLNETFLGQTPYFDEKIQAGEYDLRLTPGGDEAASGWQKKIAIGNRMLTVVHYEAGPTPETSSNQVLSLEKLGGKDEVELSLTTVPNSVVVEVDGEVEGLSPLVLNNVSAGDHVLKLEAPGYVSKTLNIKVNPGHRLRVQVQLAIDPKQQLGNQVVEEEPEATRAAEPEREQEPEDDRPEPTAEPTATPKASPPPTPGFGVEQNGVVQGAARGELEKPYVEILPASEGVDWLRVRSEPAGFVDNEVAKVQVGTWFPYLGRSDNQQWVEIEYTPQKTGFVSGAYVRVVE